MGGVRPCNKGPSGPPAEKPLKIDLALQDAISRAIRAGEPSEPPKSRNGRQSGGKEHGAA